MRIIGITLALCVSLVIVLATLGLVAVLFAELIGENLFHPSDTVHMTISLLPIMVLGGILALIVGAVIRRRPDGNRAESADEIRLMQDLHRGLTRMEERVENLETLLLEREAALR